MSRTIKFRAWDGSKMVSPDYINRKGIAYWKEDSIPQISSTIMQFTGLHDGCRTRKNPNGKEIYEGDIVEHEYESDYGPLLHTDEVIYQGGAFYPICEKPETEFRVIGNIYEHPNLKP